MLSSKEQQHLQLVWDGMGAILETKNEEVVNASFAQDFIQHNPWAKDGIEHIREMLQFDFGYKPIRWVVDGDVMAYHGHFFGNNERVVFDWFRLHDNGLIAEHWSVEQPITPREEVANAHPHF